MDHAVLKQVIFDQHEIIRHAEIVPREYRFEENANYALVGLRRAGKSTLLYGMAQRLVAQGVSWDQIIYINFEDERLAGMRAEDLNDIVLVQSELSAERGYYFFDEIQVVDGWEKFVRRLADAKEHVCITGSNAKMLSGEIASTLGGRYLIRHIDPYSFSEYLDALGQAHDAQALLASRSQGRLLAAYDGYTTQGGFPESLLFQDKRTYVEGVYQKVLLNDIAAHNGVRNIEALRLLMKKVAETVCNGVSFSSLHNSLKALGIKLSKDSLIDYIAYAKEAYLLFDVKNAHAPFVEREGNPKYYFGDTGLLALFNRDRTSALLENAVALALKRRFGDDLTFVSSAKTGIDVDFYVAEAGLAVQAAVSIRGDARAREISSLVKLAQLDPACTRLFVVTRSESEVIEEQGVTIHVVPAFQFLIDGASN